MYISWKNQIIISILNGSNTETNTFEKNWKRGSGLVENGRGVVYTLIRQSLVDNNNEGMVGWMVEDGDSIIQVLSEVDIR